MEEAVRGLNLTNQVAENTPDVVFPTNRNYGSIKNKVSICDAIEKYEMGLNMLAVVHEFGTKKYTAYSWLNNPYGSNSSVKQNMDALARHFCAHSMGKFVDEEGLPHLFHMCCRAGMLITSIYRNANYNIDYSGNVEDRFKYEILDTPLKRYDLTSQYITPEELVSLTKCEPLDLKDVKNKETYMRMHVQQQIYHAVSFLQHYDYFDARIMDRSLNKFKQLDVVDMTHDTDKLFCAVLQYASVAYDEDIYKMIIPEKIGEDMVRNIDLYVENLRIFNQNHI